VLDAGPLVALDHGETRAEAWMQVAVRRGEVLVTSAATLAECWRGGPRAARLARALKGIDVLAVSEDLGRKAGELLAAAGSDHTLDAIVVALAAQRDAAVLTSDVGDIQPLADAAGVGVLDY